jgi:hypothetical protein
VGDREAASNFQEIHLHEVEPSTLSANMRSRRFTAIILACPRLATLSRFDSGVDETSSISSGITAA